LARLLTRKLDVPFIMRPTEGPAENLKLLESGEIELAFVTLGVAQQGWSGIGDWTQGEQFRSARALFPMYDTPFQFVVMSDSDIQTVAGLSGRQIGIGPQGGTGGIYTPLVFKALKTGASFATGSWTEQAALLSARKLDAMVVAAGVPVPEVSALEAKGNVRYLTLAPGEITAVRLALPELASPHIAGRHLPVAAASLPDVGVYNFAVARADLPDDLVYAILDTVFGEHDEMMQIHPAASETVPANFTRNTILPFHAGAARWYNNNAVVGIIRGD
jgi:TRAP transporter TAXI family solute receptor